MHIILIAYLPFINGLNIVYKRLQVLKKVLTPTTLNQKYNICNWYTALKAYNKKQSINK